MTSARWRRLGWAFAIVGALGAVTNKLLAARFHDAWGGPNIGAGAVQLVFYGAAVFGTAVLVRHRRPARGE